MSRARSRCRTASQDRRRRAAEPGGVDGRHPRAGPVSAEQEPFGANWLYASTTRRRETPRSAASTRVDGSRVAGANRPVRMASRRPLASWRCSGSGAARSSSTSSSGPKVVPEIAIKVESILRPLRI